MSENQEEIYLGETIALEEMQKIVNVLNEALSDLASIELLWDGRRWFFRLYFWKD